jgi:hypothetical protein
MSQLPDGLSPLEAALVGTLTNMHRDVVKELRIFRWQTIALIVFLIGIVALSKGIDPRIAAQAATEVIAPVPVEVVAPAMDGPEPAPVVHEPAAEVVVPVELGL